MEEGIEKLNVEFNTNIAGILIFDHFLKIVSKIGSFLINTNNNINNLIQLW